MNWGYNMTQEYVTLESWFYCGVVLDGAWVSSESIFHEFWVRPKAV